MHDDEAEWLRTVARTNADLDHARRIQPGRGAPIVEPPSDWVFLVIIIALILAGFL